MPEAVASTTRSLISEHGRLVVISDVLVVTGVVDVVVVVDRVAR